MLLKLPREIRDMIYDEVIGIASHTRQPSTREQAHHVFPVKLDDQPDSVARFLTPQFFEPGLFRSCRQVNQEFLDRIERQNRDRVSHRNVSVQSEHLDNDSNPEPFIDSSDDGIWEARLSCLPFRHGLSEQERFVFAWERVPSRRVFSSSMTPPIKDLTINVYLDGGTLVPGWIARRPFPGDPPLIAQIISDMIYSGHGVRFDKEPSSEGFLSVDTLHIKVRHILPQPLPPPTPQPPAETRTRNLVQEKITSFFSYVMPKPAGKTQSDSTAPWASRKQLDRLAISSEYLFFALQDRLLPVPPIGYPYAHCIDERYNWPPTRQHGRGAVTCIRLSYHGGSTRGPIPTHDHGLSAGFHAHNWGLTPEKVFCCHPYPDDVRQRLREFEHRQLAQKRHSLYWSGP